MSRPLVPPRRVLVSIASLLAAIGLVRAGLLQMVAGAVVDHAVCNIIALILGFSALVSLLLWFLRESGHAPRLKRAVGYGLLAAVVVAIAIFRIEGVSGDLVPQVMFRWSPSRDRLLPRNDQAGAEGPSEPAGTAWEETPDDFPRFLGPGGGGGIDRPVLDPDWSARPPERAWRRAIGAGWGGFAIVGNRAVTLEQRGEEEIVSCHDAETGRPLWQVAVTARHQTVLGGIGPRSTPTIRDGVVYTTGATGWLHAIEGATGRVVWRRNVIDDLGIDPTAHAASVAWGRSGSPLVTDDLVIVPGGGPLKKPPVDGRTAIAVAAYERETGTRRWTAGDAQISYATPVLARIADGDVVIAVNEAQVAAYDPADGAERWSFDWPGHSNSDASCSQPQVLDGRRIFISKGYGIGAALFEMDDAAGAGPPAFAPLWSRANLLKTKFTNAVLHDGHAYGLSDGILECVRLADGKRAWKGGRYGQGQVLRVGNLLVVQAEDGAVVLVDCASDAQRVRGTIAALVGQTWNNPCVSGDRLLVRNAEEAACWRLPIQSDRGTATADGTDPSREAAAGDGAR